MWREPRLFTIHILDETGKAKKNTFPVYDGSVNSIDSFMELLYNYLKNFNLADANDITFCADGADWIWKRTPVLAKKLGITNYNEVLDYTHAKQNLKQILDIIRDGKCITKNKYEKTFKKLKEYLWNGEVHLIKDFIMQNCKYKRCKNEALNKIKNYFGNIKKFQYSTFEKNNIPIGSGTVESAIRRVLNLRIKGAGLFWKKENVEKIIFLRSQLLSGRWNLMINYIVNKESKMLCYKTLKILKASA